MMNLIRAASSFLLIVSLAAGYGQEARLPAAAQQALEEGGEAMSEALATYEAHYPDRALWQEAFRHGRRAKSLAPGHPEPLRFLAEAYSRANWYGPAWDAWLDYLDSGNLLDADATPLFTEVGARQGYNFYSQGQLEDAAGVYRRIIDEVPFDLEAHTWMGRLMIEMGRPEQAISYWQTVVERNPRDERAAYFLELAREQAQWGSGAVVAFREGVSFHEEGALERARERFARATSLNSEYTEAWAWLGRVAFETGNYRDALTYYRRAVRLAPENETYRYFMEEARRRLESERQAEVGGLPAREREEAAGRSEGAHRRQGEREPPPAPAEPARQDRDR